jgi:hypothetical protein
MDTQRDNVFIAAGWSSETNPCFHCNRQNGRQNNKPCPMINKLKDLGAFCIYRQWFVYLLKDVRKVPRKINPLFYKTRKGRTGDFLPSLNNCPLRHSSSLPCEDLVALWKTGSPWYGIRLGQYGTWQTCKITLLEIKVLWQKPYRSLQVFHTTHITNP